MAKSSADYCVCDVCRLISSQYFLNQDFHRLFSPFGQHDGHAFSRYMVLWLPPHLIRVVLPVSYIFLAFLMMFSFNFTLQYVVCQVPFTLTTCPNYLSFLRLMISYSPSYFLIWKCQCIKRTNNNINSAGGL